MLYTLAVILIILWLLGLNPNNVRAHTGRGQLFEKKRDLSQARADYRSAAFALTPYDNFETHVLLVVALVMVLFNFISGRRGARL